MVSIPLFLEADRGAASGAVVSVGVPFPPAALLDPAHLVVRDAAGAEVPAFSASLATWPQDGSQRAVLVAFRTTLAAGAGASFTIAYGAPRGASAGPLAGNPDGPVAAWLAPAWDAASRGIG